MFKVLLSQTQAFGVSHNCHLGRLYLNGELRFFKKMLYKLKKEKERVCFKLMVSNLLSLKTKQNQTL